MNSKTSYYVSPEKSMFTRADIKAFRERSLKLNAEGRGDQAVFYLRKRRN